MTSSLYSRSISVLLGATLVALATATGAAEKPRHMATARAEFAVGPQYDTTHVYVSAEDFDTFVASLIATFGGSTTPKGQFTVTPTPSSTLSQLVLTPVGTISVFGFKTPVPYPFGAERTGYLLSDFDKGVVAPFPDPIGRDAVLQWPGGVNMQFYWHTKTPSYPALRTIPENRIYLSADAAPAFVKAWTAYSNGRILADDARASGAEVGLGDGFIHRIRIESKFGRIAVLVTDGHLPWPYGRELTGYQVDDLPATLAKATAAGAEVLVPVHRVDDRSAAMVRFPGGYICELHAPAS